MALAITSARKVYVPIFQKFVGSLSPGMESQQEQSHHDDVNEVKDFKNIATGLQEMRYCIIATCYI